MPAFEAGSRGFESLRADQLTVKYIMDKNTFCVAPWVHATINPSGTISPCCVNLIETNHNFTQIIEWWNCKSVKDLRHDLFTGIKNKSCRICWNAESHGLESLRKIYNKEFFKHTRKDQFKNLLDWDSQTLPVTFELRLGNLCNLKCVMCDATSSSKILEEYKKNQQHYSDLIEYIIPDTTIDYSWPESAEFLKFSQYLKTAKFIKITGGEPFMNPYILDILDQIENKKEVVLNLTTNGTIKNKRILKSLSQFKTIWFTVSIDDMFDRYEYIRQGANWNKLVNNLTFFKKLPNTYFSVSVVVQAVNAIACADLFAYIDSLGFKINIIFLNFPTYLHINSLPDKVKQKAIDNLKNLKVSPSNQQQVISTIDYLEKSKYDKYLLEKMIQYFQTLDKIRNTDFLSIFPEFTPVVELADTPV